MKKLLFILLPVLLTGCAVWQKAGGPFTGAGYSINLPEGWMVNSRNPQKLVATRDAPLLQNVIVYVLDIDKQSAKEKKVLKKGMLPQEAAEVVVDHLQSDQSVAQLAVAENAPARIGGIEGFRLVYTFKQDNVRYKSVYYGALHGGKFYRISYTAPLRHYFERDVNTFEEIVRSFKQAETGS